MMEWIMPYVPIVLEVALVAGLVFIGLKIFKKFQLSKK